MFGGFTNNCIFPGMLVLPAFQKTSRETCYSKGFQKIIKTKMSFIKNRNSCKCLPHAVSVRLLHLPISEYFFCREINPSNFDTITKTL